MTGLHVSAAAIELTATVRAGAIAVAVGLIGALVGPALVARGRGDRTAGRRRGIVLVSGAAVAAAGTLALLLELAAATSALADRRPLLVAALAAGAAAAIGVGRLLAGRPRLWFLVLGAVVSLRAPLEVGDEPANLLLGLYAWVPVGIAAWAWEVRAGRARLPRLDARLDLPFLAFAAVAAGAVAWADPADNGVKGIVFFIVPFSALYWVVRAWGGRWAVWPVALGWWACAMAAALAGLYERVTHHLFLNTGLREANELSGSFRANGLYYDPNIFARFLVLAILLAVAALAARAAPRRSAPLLFGVVAVAYAGAYVSVSQSALVALVAGLLVIGLLAYGARRVGLVVAAVVLAGGAVVAVLPSGRSTTRHFLDRTDNLAHVNRVGGGRVELIQGGWDIFTDQPVAGVGYGGFDAAYRALPDHRARRKGLTLSHTTPVTVLAELGLIGILLYGAAIASWVLAGTRALRGGTADMWPAGAVAAVLVAITVHSLAYAAWLEDPTTWLAAALLVTCAVTEGAYGRAEERWPLPAAGSASPGSGGALPPHVSGDAPRAAQ